MNENIDLIKILEGCPYGTKLYTPILGDVEFRYICGDIIVIYINDGSNHAYFDKEGKYYSNCPNTECILFPSKTQRDWSKFERFWDKPKVERFEVNTFKPFDKILARDSRYHKWSVGLFSHYDAERNNYRIIGVGTCHLYAIPYNDETKHLLGTTDDCPEYYKWWEE